MPIFFLGNKPVGNDSPTLMIAEAGVNHNGDLRLAHELIRAAAQTGADVVKFQTYVTEEIIVRNAPKAEYQLLTTNPSESQFQMLKSLELPISAYSELKAHCEELGVIFLSTPYDFPSLEALERIQVAGYKIASTDTSNLPFLDTVARKGRPVILSTGMSDLDQVSEAVDTMQSAGLHDLALLQCTSEYPAPMNELNIRAMSTLSMRFNLPVGFSDHSQGIEASSWAVAAGACIIEKHFTLDRKMKGPDHAASLEPREMTDLVKLVRRVEYSLGDGRKVPTASEVRNKPRMQKSLVARRHLAQGEVIDGSALNCKRPADGLSPSLWKQVVGRKTARAINVDETLTNDMIQWD